MSLRSLKQCLAVVVLAPALSTTMLADQSDSVTLAGRVSFNLDTGLVSSNVSSNSGDILWNGTVLTPQGRAGLYNLGKYGARVFKSIHARAASAAPYNAAPIPASALVAGDVFGVRTNRGQYAKVIVTSVNGASLTLEYTTFAPAGSTIAARPAAVGPVGFLEQVQNNYSFLLPGAPDYGIAPGSLFVVTGFNLNSTQTPVLQSSAAPGLPTSLNQTSVSVTVNGVTTTPALYYASATAVAGVLPSTTPVGSGAISLTYNGQPDSSIPIQVVPSAVGLDTLYGTGAGSGVITDTSFNVLGLTNSAMPGQAVVLWGSGVGADTSNNDTTYPQTENNLTNIPMQVYIGGISANILYRGRSQYPGVDQINVVIPSNVSPGCYVSVVVETGSVVSNTVTVPVSPNAGACSDPALGLSGAQLQSLAAKGATAVNSLAVTVSQYTKSDGTAEDQASVFASSLTSAEFGSGNYYASEGSCSVFQPGTGFPFQAPLDAGAVQVTGPSGSLALPATEGIFYGATLPAGSVTSNPGTYTFTGSGGADIGSFKVAVNVQTPITLTNKGALASINRSQGATITWSGGFANGNVLVNGVGASPNGSVNFYCNAPSGAGQLTIPSSTLLALAAGGGKLMVTNSTAPQIVSASGLDLGLATGVVSFDVPTVFK